VYDGVLCLPRRRGGLFPPLRVGETTVRSLAAGVLDPERIQADVSWLEPVQGAVLRRRWTLIPGTDAVVMRASIRSQSVPQALDCWKSSFDNVVETIPLDFRGWEVTSIRFRGRTDLHNDYVTEVTQPVPSESGVEIALTGNLLILERSDGAGLFVLHESPPEDERRPEVDATFRVGPDGVRVMGWGVRPEDVNPERERWSYPVAVGVFSSGGALISVRRYLKARFPVHPLDMAVVANPWGDGHCYEKFSEAFVMAELEGTARIGATHYQIDDGWQAGGTLPDLTCNNMARTRDYWDIDSRKFPQGFGPLADTAAQHGVGLALWFAPDVARGYRNWQEDRDILLEMHRQYGIDLVKLDGVRIYTKDAEEGLLNLLEGVVAGSEGKVRFNMDVTNGLRLGYFTSMRFGTIFVENRYVTGRQSAERTYYPWRVLRNLWRSSLYLPPERLQFEFANLVEAVANENMQWDGDSLLTPFNCSWEYIAAVPMMAAPLCWLEPSSLPADVQDRVRGVLELHRAIAPDLMRGYTFPVGEEPSGHSWTGFDCVDPEDTARGILAVYREDTDDASVSLRLAGVDRAGDTVRLRCLSHAEPERSVGLDGEGGIPVAIDQRNDYRVYRYELSEG
jgi:hypothetical protein